jgi:hypothetical protein
MAEGFPEQHFSMNAVEQAAREAGNLNVQDEQVHQLFEEIAGRLSELSSLKASAELGETEQSTLQRAVQDAKARLDAVIAMPWWKQWFAASKIRQEVQQCAEDLGRLKKELEDTSLSVTEHRIRIAKLTAEIGVLLQNWQSIPKH